MDALPVAIIGGGPAGSAAAVELRRRGRPAFLIERSAYADFRIGESVPPPARQILTELGLDESLLREGSLPSYGIQAAWGSDQLHDRSFVLNPYGHGWHIDRRRFDESLVEAAAAHGAEVFRQARLVDWRPSADGCWDLTVGTVSGLESRRVAFLIDASGRSASIGRRLGAVRTAFDRQIAVTRIYSPAPSVEPVTLVESVEQGWWYSAPVPGSALMVAYLTDVDLYWPDRTGATEAWTRRLAGTRYTRARVEGLCASGPLRRFMADTRRVRCLPGQGWVNAGAAAAGLDPLSSEGICFALRSGQAAGAAAAAHFDGDTQAIAAYLRSLDSFFDSYLQQRSAYYASETRWSRSPFWSRRLQAVCAPVLH